MNDALIVVLQCMRPYESSWPGEEKHEELVQVRVKVYNVFCAQVGASNELPESEELDALYDRFLIRRHVAQVCPDSARPILWSHKFSLLLG